VPTCGRARRPRKRASQSHAARPPHKSSFGVSLFQNSQFHFAPGRGYGSGSPVWPWSAYANWTLSPVAACTASVRARTCAGFYSSAPTYAASKCLSVSTTALKASLRPVFKLISRRESAANFQSSPRATSSARKFLLRRIFFHQGQMRCAEGPRPVADIADITLA
jgi:hypothetical protein